MVCSHPLECGQSGMVPKPRTVKGAWRHLEEPECLIPNCEPRPTHWTRSSQSFGERSEQGLGGVSRRSILGSGVMRKPLP